MSLINIVIAASAMMAAIGTINIILLRAMHSSWWKIKTVRTLALMLPILAIISTALWAFGHHYDWQLLTRLVSITTPALFIMEMALLAALPFSGITHVAVDLINYIKRKRQGPAYSEGRRSFVKGAAAIFPIVAIPSGVAGVADSFAPIKVEPRSIPITDLPPALQGFKIAHLSDLHLGYYVHLGHLESAVEKIKLQQPDLALVTGDISDDLTILSQAIAIINSIRPRYGIYAGVGNHEYYRGIVEVMQIFSKAPFPMLINQRINLLVNNVRISLGGCDDPRTLRRDYAEFLQDTIERTMGSAPSDTFRLLMCHRPEGFNYSAQKGIDLVLSGHTHGGQVGWGGRSAFEPIFPEKYMWGIYQRGKTTLHTSGGMGHWLPFRLGVPAEAPILTLEKA